MKASDAIRTAAENEGMSYSAMARCLGRTNGSYVSNPLNRNSMNVGKLLELAGVLGYELVLRKDDEEYVITE